MTVLFQVNKLKNGYQPAHAAARIAAKGMSAMGKGYVVSRPDSTSLWSMAT
jgi:hypothetical protein